MVQHLNRSQNGDPVTGVVPKSGDSTCSIVTREGSLQSPDRFPLIKYRELTPESCGPSQGYS